MAIIDSEFERLLEKSGPKSYPDAIVFNILSRLPVKSILRFKSVCRKWSSTFAGTEFIEAHMNQSIKRSDHCFLANEFKDAEQHAFLLWREENFKELCSLHVEDTVYYNIVASANGIVCIICYPLEVDCNKNIIGGYLDILFWNPATKEAIILPKFAGQDQKFRFCMGFGFDSRNNDFKVVGFLGLKDSVELKIYSLRSNCWRTVEVSSYDLDGSFATYVNDTFHWLGKNANHYLIVAFDVTEENFVEIEAPNLVMNNSVLVTESPESLGKSLVLCDCGSKGEWQIWLMKEYGNSKSWTILYCIPPHPIYGESLRPHIFLDDGEIVMVGDLMHLYDPKNQMYKSFDNEGLFEAVKYKESLVSVKGGGSITNTVHCALISNDSVDFY